MSDLQCPALIVLLTPETLGAPALRGRRFAGVLIAASIPESSDTFAEAAQLAAANSCKLERAQLDQLNELADLYRGETVALIAPSDLLCAAIQRTTPPAQPVVLAIDGDGWNVRSG